MPSRQAICRRYQQDAALPVGRTTEESPVTFPWDREKVSICIAQPGVLSSEVLVEPSRQDLKCYLEAALEMGWSPRRAIRLQLAGGVVEEVDMTEQILDSTARIFRLCWGWSRIVDNDAADLVTALGMSDDMTLQLLAQQVSGSALDIYPKKEYDMLVRRAPRRRLAAQPSARYIPADVRTAVWHRDGGHCARCGAAEELEFDHVIPVAKGGSSMVNNVELLCLPCNRRKSDRIS